MAKYVRLVIGILILLSVTPARAQAQVRKLTIHIVVAGTAGDVRVFSGAVTTCQFLTGTCVADVSNGATVRLAADFPGRLSRTGPAAGCALSTCTFVMTADASVTATFTAGDGPMATLTTTLLGNGNGAVTVDGVRCTAGGCSVGCALVVCTRSYLQGSSVELAADGGTLGRFTGYSSATGDASVCGAAANCSFTLNGNASVTATFLPLTSYIVTPSSAVGTPGGPPQTFTAIGTYTGGVTGVIPPGKGAWSSAPLMPSPRDRLAAASLNGKVYAVGGQGISFDPSSVSNQLFAFDPVTGWATLAPMLAPRSLLGVTTAGGRLYAVGGLDDTGALLASAERYDPVTNAWTPIAPM